MYENLTDLTNEHLLKIKQITYLPCIYMIPNPFIVQY